MPNPALARADTGNPQWTLHDGGRIMRPQGRTPVVLDEGGNLVVATRILSHPALPQVVDDGIYVYPEDCLPHRTVNFDIAPARKVDTSVVRTLGSSVCVKRAQMDEDCIISEIWDASMSPITTLVEMVRVFQRFYQTPLGVGQALGWHPRDLSMDRFRVEIVSLTIGGIDWESNELPDPEDATKFWSDATVQLALKLIQPVIPPKASITLEGI